MGAIFETDPKIGVLHRNSLVQQKSTPETLHSFLECSSVGHAPNDSTCLHISVECTNCMAVVCISEDPGKEPEHMVFTKLHIVESRLDYMGSSILMGRVSDLAVKMNDEWHVDTGTSKSEERRPSIATSR